MKTTKDSVNEPRLNGLTRAHLEAQLASAIERKCWWAEDAIRADLRALDELGENEKAP